MTNRKYLKHLIKLTMKLTDIVESDGYRSDAYYEVLDEISQFASNVNRPLWRPPWGLICFCAFLLYCLIWLAWAILH